MKAVMVMFDSLNRHMLPPYGCDWVHAPNFSRLAEKTVTFTNAFVGSMPCMPARREIHTGRYNFLHRSWGPIEPFDDSMPEILKNNNVRTHLISDHYHYWEDGGATYHTRYNAWEILRGQEGDPWKTNLTDDIKYPPEHPNRRPDYWVRQDWVNRHYMQEIDKQPQSKTFAMAREFLETNHKADNWFLHIETFDPHEPYFVAEIYRKHYEDNYKGVHYDWPTYGKYYQDDEQINHLRALNAALISMCDENLGRVLDIFDKYNLWEDTLLIVNTDHGFLLGERECWGKCVMPFYNEVARVPLFVWNPKTGEKDIKNDSLVQTIDIAPTLYDFFDVETPADVQGISLIETLKSNKPLRQAMIFGIHGGHVNITDGKYVYMRAPANKDNQPLFEYTLMPTNMKKFFSGDELKKASLHKGFEFTKGMPVLEVPAENNKPQAFEWGSMLFDIEKDPEQLNPVNEPDVERRLINEMIELMRQNDAPKSQYIRLGLL